MKPFLWILIALILVFGAFLFNAPDKNGFLSDQYTASQQDEVIAALPATYRPLGAVCKTRESFSCCISSVQTIADNGYTVFNSPDEPMVALKCPQGFSSDSLRCPDSFNWCMPVE